MLLLQGMAIFLGNLVLFFCFAMVQTEHMFWTTQEGIHNVLLGLVK